MRETAPPSVSSITGNYLMPAMLGAITALAIVAAGYPYVVLILGGIFISLFSMISAPFGIAVLLGTSALFSRSELFSLSLPLFGGGLKPTDILLASIISGWLARSALKMRIPDVPRRMALIILAFTAWAVIGVVLGIANGAYYKHSLLELRPLLHFLLILPIAADFTRKDIDRLIVFLLVISVAVSAKGIYLYFRGIGEPALFSEGNIRVTSIEFLYPVASALAAIGLFLKRKGPMPVLMGILFLNCAALAVTFHRAAWLALFISVLFLVIAQRDFRRGIVFSSVLFAAGAAVFITVSFSSGSQKFMTGLQGRMTSISSYKTDVSAQHRLEEWKACLNLIKQHPVTGIGLGSKVYFYSPMYSETKKRLGYLSDDFYVHNSFMWILVKTGIIGTLLFVVFLLTSYRLVLHSILRPRPGEQQTAFPLLASILVAITVSSFFGPMLTSDLVTPLVAFTVGGLYCVKKEDP